MTIILDTREGGGQLPGWGMRGTGKMDRYTRKDAEAAFERLLAATGNRKATSWNDVGGWALDYAACYGSYVVEEVSNSGGGVSQPFGSLRRTAREFVDAVRFACDAIDQPLLAAIRAGR